MPAPYLTPDVYIEEISVFPPSVVAVGTAIPAFVGYTEKAKRALDNDLRLKPTKVYSLKEYESLFGFPPNRRMTLTIHAVGDTFAVDSFFPPGETAVSTAPPDYLLYYAVKMYFDNGGGECYVVSVGGYETPSDIAVGELQQGLDAVRGEDEPTLIVIPEAVNLTIADYTALTTAVLLQCQQLQDRFGIIDVHAGGAALDAAALGAARTAIASPHLRYGAAYYPFLRTTMNHWLVEGDATSNVDVVVGAAAAVDMVSLKSGATSTYNFAKAALKDYYVTMPPSGAVAGVYAATDGARGVWKAPAGVPVADAIEPMVKLDSKRQAAFNVDADTGKSINVMRGFAGKGTLVWGARTLDGNSNEWRYISVRRFFNMVEESVKKSTYWAVFENNDANTWVKVRGMIENFLIDRWREGALAGATTKEAFFVKCGLGSTMSAQDILEGRMNVEVGMAVVRPAEFIILKFSHKLQTS